MKKMLCLMFAGMILFSGCAKDEEKQAVCRIDKDGITEEMTVNALNDQVLSTSSLMKLPFSMYEIETDEEKELFIEQMLLPFQIDGVNAVSKSTDDEFVLEMTIDLTTASFETLVELGMLASEDLDAEIISFEKTVEGLKASGYACE